MSGIELDLQALDHLVEIAKTHGIAIDRKAIDSQFLVGDEALTETRFLRIAKDIGLEVASKNLSWHKLRRLGQAYHHHC